MLSGWHLPPSVVARLPSQVLSGRPSCGYSVRSYRAAGVDAGEQQAPALVHEVAHRHRGVVRLLAGDAGLRGRPRDVVVARVPDDRVVVAEHAERVRRGAALRVDVPDVGADPVRGERGLVVVEVERPGGARVGGERRVARVVLRREDQHARAGVRPLGVGERLGLDVVVVPAALALVVTVELALEPDLHAVAGPGAARSSRAGGGRSSRPCRRSVSPPRHSDVSASRSRPPLMR